MVKSKKLFKYFFTLSLYFFVSFCFAGNQQYEILQASTKQLLSQSINDQSQNNSFLTHEEQKIWIKKYLPIIEKTSIDSQNAQEFLLSVHYESTRAGLNPILIMGLIKVESNFKKYAVSSVGARGFMQVMPFWIDIIGEKTHNLFDLKTNLRFGCTILRHYLTIEKGNMFRALARYNGSLGKDTYPQAVMSSFSKIKDIK